jgi:hypothetical protein
LHPHLLLVQAAAIDSLASGVAAQLQAALDTILSLQPSHQEDMRIIEATDK